MSKEFLDRKLKSIGKTSFVDFYWDYKKLYLKKQKGILTQIDKEELSQRLLNENSKATKISGQPTRINASIAIFENKLYARALEKVIASKSARVTIETKNKAKCILKKEKNN